MSTPPPGDGSPPRAESTAPDGAAGVMSVLHVSQPTDYGVAQCVADLVADQVRRGWSVTVACPRDGWLAKAAVAAGAAYRPWDARRSPGPWVVGEARRLGRIVASTDPSIVHLHSSKAGLAGRWAIRSRWPTLFHTHAWSFLALSGVPRTLAVEWERWAVRWADTIVCCSQGEADLGRAAGIGGRVVVVPNAVDLSRFPPSDPEVTRQEARRDLGVGDWPLAVCVGRLARQKGQDWLLGAWRTVGRQAPSARLVLVGDGPDRRQLAAMAPPGVDLVGRRGDPRRWLEAADVVVMPSRYDTMPLALLEAMAAGRSVVVSDVPGVAEALEGADDPVGAVVALGDERALASALADRLLDPDRTGAEGAAARRHVERRYGLDRWLGSLAELAAVTARRRPGRPGRPGPA